MAARQHDGGKYLDGLLGAELLGLHGHDGYALAPVRLPVSGVNLGALHGVVAGGDVALECQVGGRAVCENNRVPWQTSLLEGIHTRGVARQGLLEVLVLEMLAAFFLGLDHIRPRELHLLR